MISTHIATRGTPNVLAVFSFRYDAHLVPAMLANVAPLVGGWIAYDDRGSVEPISDEAQRKITLLTAARETGAHWVLAVDPDERFEWALALDIGRLTATREALAYTFRLREMYTPDSFRVDGLWWKKRQARLLPIWPGVAVPRGSLHVSWAAFIPGVRLRDTDFNLYHLKMITPERRRARAALYNHLDPERQAQPIGYDYLTDDEGLKLKRIGAGREYHPPHDDDGGLWMPQLSP